jgi:hypothetical protein
MATLLRGAGVADVAPIVAWLWDEQPRTNLWRAQVPGMVELARELAGRGVAVAVLSSSEGRLAELLAEIGVVDAFAAVIDSGRVGIEKARSPDLRSRACRARCEPARHPRRRLVAGRRRGGYRRGLARDLVRPSRARRHRSARRGRARRRRGARRPRRLA